MISKTNDRVVSEREVNLLRYALVNGAAFCQQNKNIRVLSIPIWGENGTRIATEEIWAICGGESEGHVVSEKIVSRRIKW